MNNKDILPIQIVMPPVLAGGTYDIPDPGRRPYRKMKLTDADENAKALKKRRKKLAKASKKRNKK